LKSYITYYIFGGTLTGGMAVMANTSEKNIGQDYKKCIKRQ